MIKTYRFRMYPTLMQTQEITKTFDAVRIIYNYFTKLKKDGILNLNKLQFYKNDILKKYPYIKKVDQCSINNIYYLLESYNYLTDKSIIKFKNKYSKQIYKTNQFKMTYTKTKGYSITLDLFNKYITLPKIGKIKIRGYRKLKSIDAVIKFAYVIKEKTGKYYVCVVVDEYLNIATKSDPKSIIGVDLGIIDLVTTSNGEKYKNQKLIDKYEKRIKICQIKLSRKQKDSANYLKAKQKLAIVYSRLKNARKQFECKITNEITKDNDIIVAEKINILKLIENNPITRYILDASFNRIIQRFKRKCLLLGKFFYQVNQYFPSTKLCSHCDYKNEDLNDLDIRLWECPNCKYLNDRDFNAASNIMFEGLKLHYSN